MFFIEIVDSLWKNGDDDQEKWPRGWLAEVTQVEMISLLDWLGYFRFIINNRKIAC